MWVWLDKSFNVNSHLSQLCTIRGDNSTALFLKKKAKLWVVYLWSAACLVPPVTSVATFLVVKFAFRKEKLQTVERLSTKNIIKAELTKIIYYRTEIHFSVIFFYFLLVLWGDGSPIFLVFLLIFHLTCHPLPIREKSLSLSKVFLKPFLCRYSSELFFYESAHRLRRGYIHVCVWVIVFLFVYVCGLVLMWKYILSWVYIERESRRELVYRKGGRRKWRNSRKPPLLSFLDNKIKIKVITPPSPPPPPPPPPKKAHGDYCGI